MRINSVARILFTLSFSAALFSQAAIPKSCQKRLSMNPQGASGALFSAEDVNSIYNDREVSEGVGRFFKLPKSPYDIYFENADFPASPIDRRASTSKAFWSKVPAALTTEFNSQNFDWMTYAELNQSAEEIWQEMKSCNQGDLNQVRKNFFIGTPCTNLEDSKVLKQKLTALNMNLTQYLMSAPLMSYRLNIPEQHPLLQQLMIMLSAITTNTKQEGPRKISKILIETSLWDSNLVQSKWSKDPSDIPLAKLQFNLSTFLASKIDHCADFGLWPAMNRVFHQLSNATWTTEYEPFQSLAEKTGDMSFQLCGSRVFLDQPIKGSYSGFALEHILQMRRLYATYYSSELKSPEIEGLRIELKLKPGQALQCQ